MQAKYQNIILERNASFLVQRFDRYKDCFHKGLHFHHSYEIVFIKNGTGKIVIKNHSYEYENGLLIFLGPYLPHFSFSNNEFIDNFETVIHFDEFFIESRIKQIPEFHSLMPLLNRSHRVIIFDDKVKKEQTTLFQNLESLNPLEQLSGIFNLLCKLTSKQEFQYLLDKPIENNFKDNKQFEKILNYININYANCISTKDIAIHLNLTTNSFCKLFKKITSKTFITYLNEYRIQRAINLIKTTSNNISEIAFKCGFENLSYFSKVFLKIKGISPNNYKKNYHLRSIDNLSF